MTRLPVARPRGLPWRVIAMGLALMAGACGGEASDGGDGSLLAEAERTFCDHMLPIFGVTLDLSLVTSGTSPLSDEEESLFVEASPATLRKAAANLLADAEAFEELGEEDLARAARAIGAAADSLASATGEPAQILEEFAEALMASGLPSNYCEDVSGADFFRGYTDGWLARDPESRTGDYARGYERGFAEGWRDEVEGATGGSRAQELRDALDAILNEQPGAYDRIVQLRDEDIDLVGSIMCKGTRRGRDSDELAARLIEVFDLSPRDAAVALGMLVVVYCPELIPA